VALLVEALRYPDGVTEIFYKPNPSGRPAALGLFQPLTEMSARGICFEVKAYFMCLLSRMYEGLKFLEPAWLVQACNGIAFSFFREGKIQAYETTIVCVGVCARTRVCVFVP
jgi:hypothetical protein